MVPFMFVFFAVAVGVHHQQHKQNKRSDEQYDNRRMIMPQILGKTGKLVIHSLNYTGSAENKICRITVAKRRDCP